MDWGDRAGIWASPWYDPTTNQTKIYWRGQYEVYRKDIEIISKTLKDRVDGIEKSYDLRGHSGLSETKTYIE